jgi:hypothetical protein
MKSLKITKEIREDLATLMLIILRLKKKRGKRKR